MWCSRHSLPLSSCPRRAEWRFPGVVEAVSIKVHESDHCISKSQQFENSVRSPFPQMASGVNFMQALWKLFVRSAGNECMKRHINDYQGSEYIIDPSTVIHAQ